MQSDASTILDALQGGECTLHGSWVPSRAQVRLIMLLEMKSFHASEIRNMSVCMTDGKEAHLDFVGWDKRTGAWQTRDFNWAERGVLLALLSAQHLTRAELALTSSISIYMLMSGSSESTMR
jgi:hypothetical protein